MTTEKEIRKYWRAILWGVFPPWHYRLRDFLGRDIIKSPWEYWLITFAMGVIFALALIIMG